MLQKQWIIFFTDFVLITKNNIFVAGRKLFRLSINLNFTKPRITKFLIKIKSIKNED